MSGLGERGFTALASIKVTGDRITGRGIELVGPCIGMAVFGRRISRGGVSGVISGSSVIVSTLSGMLAEIVTSEGTGRGGVPFVRNTVRKALNRVAAFLPGAGDCRRVFGLPSVKGRLSRRIVRDLGGIASNAPPIVNPAPGLVNYVRTVRTCGVVAKVKGIAITPGVLSFSLLSLNSFLVRRLWALGRGVALFLC